MAAIKKLTDASDKWTRRATIAAPDYEKGVKNPKRSWAEAAKAAQEAYRAGVTKAATEGRYAKGVELAGDQKWQQMAAKKGPGRFSEGVTISKEEWMKGFQPFHATIEAVVLPERGPKGDPKNLQRVVTIATALRALKEKIGK